MPPIKIKVMMKEVIMDKLYTMRQASELVGLTVRYLQILDKRGKIECVRTPGGKRRIPESEVMRLRGKVKSEQKWAIYARVSSHEQKTKGDLERQIKYLQKIVPKKAKEIKVVMDVGRGLNDNRKGLKELMNLAIAGEISDIAITDKDRLTRFGFHYLSKFFTTLGVEIHVMSEEKNKSLEEELVQDMLSIVTSFSGKLYGIRSAKRKKLIENVREVIQQQEEKQG
jgi:excisionase family DNA binding protein